MATAKGMGKLLCKHSDGSTRIDELRKWGFLSGLLFHAYENGVDYAPAVKDLT